MNPDLFAAAVKRKDYEQGDFYLGCVVVRDQEFQIASCPTLYLDSNQ
jgi:hypothetical protein